MRSTFFLLAFLLLEESLTAQNYLQNNPPVQQTQSASDCYTRNLDNGNAALRRGETREALRHFNLAKNCPEAVGNLRRQTELDTKISQCEAALGIYNKAETAEKPAAKLAAASQKRRFSNEMTVARRNYPANSDFLRDTVEDCFQRMVEEADRAFRLRFWEDAAALYRAAKNCADADQNDRSAMSQKIYECRTAAENELFAKQQEAERQARHAIAANLADDAQELLHTTDRSLAFRLADFANQYIAPDDNPDCQQALFDAWYYQAIETPKYGDGDLLHPVFCYELADNLGESTQLKFRQQRDGSQWLWAFAPKTGDMFAWEFPSMKLAQSYGTGEGNNYIGFDIAPDGELLFWGNKYFDLRRGARSVRVDVPSIASWCFNARGDEFFFENTAEQKIYVLNVRDAFAQQYARKGSKSGNAVQQIPVVPREIVSGVPEGLLAIHYVEGKFWLGFRDRIEILSKPEPGKPWRRERTIVFEGLEIPDFVELKDLRLQVFPKEAWALLSANSLGWIISFDMQGGSAVVKRYENQRILATSGPRHQIACEYNGDYRYSGFWVMNTQTGDTLVRQRMPHFAEIEHLAGCFSADGRWVAAPSTSGNVKVWALQIEATVWETKLPHRPEDKPKFSPDGTLLFYPFSDTLAVFAMDGSDDAGQFWKNSGQPLRGASDQWVMVQISPDSAEAHQLASGRKLRLPLQNPGVSYLYAFDPTGENLVAYLSDWNTVEVRSLKTGALVSRRAFDGGSIGDLYFVPGSNHLIVVQHVAMGESEIDHSSLKTWSPLNGNEKPKAFRMHDYAVRSVAIHSSGNQIAVSDGSDIRIFDLQFPGDELLKIRALASEYVQAIAFQPNSNLLAAAYSTGKVLFWNCQTGQISLQIQAVPNQDLVDGYSDIGSIGFSHGGSILQVVVNDGRILAYELDPSAIREAVQNENRQLQAFEEDHIVRYNLEAALYYPNNFERLAASGDAPLIRSFFRHFSMQAVQSNNIVQVRDYCERALFLYERLDANTREIWQPEIRGMYEDYARKLLLRGNTQEATSVLTMIKRAFKYEPVMLNAHLALLRRNYQEASSLYTKYLLTEEGDLPVGPNRRWVFDNVENEMIQLRDYENLDSAQISCFCGTVSQSRAFYNFCPEPRIVTAYQSQTDRTQWEIFEKRDNAEATLRHAEKAQLLESAQQKAKSLLRQNPSIGQSWLESVTLELASAHQRWGIFEQNSPEAPPHFEKAIQLLTEIGPFKKLSDTSRLSLLASSHLVFGKYLLNAGNTVEAIAQFTQGLKSAQLLSELAYVADTSLLRNYYDNLAGPLFEKLGTAYLLEGNTAEARKYYDQANIYFVTYGLNTLYQATAAVLENDESEAFINYGGITEASQTAEALFLLNRLAEQMPERRSQLDAFSGRLRDALRERNPRLANAEADYWYAKLKSDHLAAMARWDSAATWSAAAMESAKRCSELPNADDNWKRLWLDEYINLPYFMLLGGWEKPASLAECIRLVERAEDYLAKQPSEFYYGNRELLKTNLAHALVLRNQPGDRARAIELYRQFVQSYADSRGYDNLDLLQKDMRDLQRVGAPWPELPKMEEGQNR